ncbi:MAG: carbamoyltransferase HypF [Candidatus Bathyarchaeota archaeon]|nr:carbamoyltransferase HypF [Candidatus Bathyarchaeota archaeon]
MRAEIKALGIVQGVGFRPFIFRIATANNLKGYVRNRGDAGVEIVVEGMELDINHFLNDLEKKRPPLACVYKTLVRYKKGTGSFNEFTILKSSEAKELAGSVIPPDIAICNECLKELRNPSDPRHDYFFITCTNCGPRYTTIRKLPYDRQNTTMQDFEMCEFCKTEYTNPANRRFHAQTVACPKCGPQAYLTTNKGELVPLKDPIREAGHLLEAGHVLAIKGYGGFHVATATTKDDPIRRLREVKQRAQKPFAIMARNLQTVRTFANVSQKEAKTLSSHARPIVLLDKAENYYLSELIAPSLHNVGVMLPYTGLHVMLFDQVKEPAFVMTSANPPSQPIVADNIEALKTLGSAVDYFLFHNRAIAQRCDDSVIRLHNRKMSFIRRSRGYAPAPVNLKHSFSKCVLGVGAEENVTSCILWHDKAFISQYIGDVENLETLTFLKRTIRHLTSLTNAKIDAVACDLHPKFATTRLAQEIADEVDCSVTPVQHHHAHMLSLMGEHGLDEIVGIVCDGYGYGENGKPWGGEVLHCSQDRFNRVGHLQEQLLVGGDLVARYPLRMAAGILNDVVNIENWLLRRSKYLPHGKEEAQTIISQLNSKHPPLTTTSCGRVLDAVSAILDICHERTYQGEPAMKLEAAATHGQDMLKLEPEIENEVLDTTRIVRAVFEAKDDFSTADLAYSTQSYMAKGMAQLAVGAAQKIGIKAIGFSGGVAYNKHITSAIKKLVEKKGVKFYMHNSLPAGDGGISFGQALAAVICASG